MKVRTDVFAWCPRGCDPRFSECCRATRADHVVTPHVPFLKIRSNLATPPALQKINYRVQNALWKRSEKGLRIPTEIYG
jgi:hypothetical protein